MIDATTVEHTDMPQGVMNFADGAKTLHFKRPPTVPEFKKQDNNAAGSGRPLVWQSSSDRQDAEDEAGADQRSIWVEKNKAKVIAEVTKDLYPGAPKTEKRLRSTKGLTYLYFGDAEKVGTEITVPVWNSGGDDVVLFDVDHMHEFQLGGDYEKTENLWLLRREANRASGRFISKVVREQVKRFVVAVAPMVKSQGGPDLGDKSVRPDLGWNVTWDRGSTPDPTDQKPSANLTGFKFEAHSWGPAENAQGAAADAKVPKIASTEHTAGLKEAEGTLSSDPDHIMVLNGESSGLVRWLDRAGGKPKGSEQQKGKGDQPVGPGAGGEWSFRTDLKSRNLAKKVEGGKVAAQHPVWQLTSFTWLNPGQKADAPGQKVGLFKGTAFKSVSKGNVTVEGHDPDKKADTELLEAKDLAVDLYSMSGVEWGGYYKRDEIAATLKGETLTWKSLSPVKFSEMDFDLAEGLAGRGKIDPPSLKILEKADIAVVLGGDLGVGLEATIIAGQLSLPGPLQVKGGALTLGVGIGGITADGRLDFEIKNLATGFIEAAAAMKKGGSPTFALAGELNFDTKMFDKAKLGISYVDQEWGVTGELAVDTPGKIKGIKKARATIEITDGDVKADGTFQPDIKGIESGHLGLHYNEATGPEITGDVTLGKGFPGIKSGKISAIVTKPPGAEGWSLDATGTAEPDIPGVQSQINVAYKNGVFDANVAAAYNKGMMSGQLMFGATNRPVSTDGKPGDAPADPAAAKITAYGSGQMTVTLTPWLAGTVGVKVLPNGEIELMGRIALPNTLDIFAQKKLQKELFKIGIDIPIVGVAVAGQRIGIFATIQGGADIEASVGPGQLQQLSLEVHYNPAHEEETTITGGAKVRVPAMAGLRLFVRGALGAGIPVVSAEAGLEVSGELGIQGEAAAAVAVNWSPTQGLDLKAEASVQAEPVFKFGIAGYVLVEADLWVTTVELYSKRWQLADVTLGSGLKLGMRLPLHYHEGTPFEISASDVQFDVPKIDPEQILTDLMKRIA
jgi:hypothetical protein